MITIVDYGMGNLGSIHNMLKRIGHESQITSDPTVVNKASKLILPGVGAFDVAIENIHSKGLLEVLNRKALEEKIPVLGICLGMQLITRNSEEGQLPGLGWVDANVKKFRFDTSSSLKVPHMGWNVTNPMVNHQLFNGFDSELRFYFVHSYYVECYAQENVLATTNYGLTFCSALQKENVIGVQFHPEKSHKYGKILLRNFCEYQA